MSSTKRGSSRTEADNYPSPPWTVKRLLDFVPLPLTEKVLPPAPQPPAVWLECSAGEGWLLRGVKEWIAANGKPAPEFHALDIREECRHPLERLIDRGGLGVTIDDFTKADVLAINGGEKYAVTITNPPYYNAEEMLHRALAVSVHVVFLLRMNFFGTQGRSEFFRTNCPSIYTLPNRPKFSGKGTDSIEYAWFHWDTRRPQRTGRVAMLGDTPLAERKADARRMGLLD